MIQQGYVPPTCTLDDNIAGPLIYSEIAAGRSPCWGCDMDMLMCKGQPKKVTQGGESEADNGK